MNVISSRAESLTAGALHELLGYRHKVFVDMLKWDLSCIDGIEMDQFDRPDTVYVISRDRQGEINGCARLLPTTSPYLLGDVFPELMNDLPIPRSNEIWELSRFAAVDFCGENVISAGQFSSHVTLGLLDEAVKCAGQIGAKKLITVSPVGIERLLKKTGYKTYRAGPPKLIGGHHLVACWIEVGEKIELKKHN